MWWAMELHWSVSVAAALPMFVVNLASKKKLHYWPFLASICHEIILFEQELASFKEIFANNKIVDSMFRNKVWLNMSKAVCKSGVKCRDAATGGLFPKLVFLPWQASLMSHKWFLSLVFLPLLMRFLIISVWAIYPLYSRTRIQKGVEEGHKEGIWQTNIWLSFSHSYWFVHSPKQSLIGP